MRIELATSSLPRKCSTTELQRHCFIHTYNNKDELQAALLLFKFYFQHLFPSLSIFSLSGKRGSNPPPIAWKAIALPNELLPQCLTFRCGGGDWTRTNELRRGQIYSLLQLPLCDSPVYPSGLRDIRADEGTRTPDRLITNQLLYQLSYIGFCFPISNYSFSPLENNFFSKFEVAKIQTFFIPTKFFSP